MKPRNKREREVAELSSTLPPISEKQEEWAKAHVFSHEAYKCKDELWCSHCAHTWIDTSNSELSVEVLGDTTVCPYCGSKLTVKVSRKRKADEVQYMTIATVRGGYQVLRHVYCQRYIRKENAFVHYYLSEMVQEWISEDGKRTVIARPMNMGGAGWLYGQPLSIKNEYGSSYCSGDMYAIRGELYPKPQILPILRKYGLKNSFHDCCPSRLIKRLLLADNDYELCLKTKQFSMLQYLSRRGDYQIRYKPSFNICNRNGYKIKDASIWVDYLDLLVYFGKDVQNAYYVCPKNLKKEHDILMNKKNKIEARLRAQRDRETAIKAAIKKKKDILNFYREKMKFFGIEIKEGDITIHPLESITQFYLEGKAMHHCVFDNWYYRKSDCLILSARDSQGNRLETIEVSLKTFEIVQSRAVCNNVSKYHDRILNLVKKNMNLIRQRMAA